MYVLIEYNRNLKEILNEIEKYDYVGIVLFKLILNNKTQIKTDLNVLLSLKNKVIKKFKGLKCGVLVEMERQDNSTVGVISNLKREFDIVIGQGGLNKFNRFFLENTKIDFLLDPQSSKFKVKIDFIHHFNTGINHVLAEYASSRDIGFIFSLNFFQANKKYVPKEIGRVNQNLRFARKYGVPSVINFILKDVYDVKSLVELRSIYSFFDISTNQVEEGFKALGVKIAQNEFKKSKKYVADGIELI